MEPGCKTDITEHICPMSPHPSVPKRQSLWQMLVCCYFIKSAIPGGQEKEQEEGGRGGEQSGGYGTDRPLLGFIMTSQ